MATKEPVNVGDELKAEAEKLFAKHSHTEEWSSGAMADLMDEDEFIKALTEFKDSIASQQNKEMEEAKLLLERANMVLKTKQPYLFEQIEQFLNRKK